MSERGLEFEQGLIGWLAHSPKGRGEFAGFYVPGRKRWSSCLKSGRRSA